MKNIIVNCERPSLVVFKSGNNKACRLGYTAEELFQKKHKFVIHLYAADEGCDAEQRYLGALDCMRVNADSAKDVQWCRSFGLSHVMDNVQESGYAVDNLAVVTGACFVIDVPYEDLDTAFRRLHCVFCEAMAELFGLPERGRNVGMYFDFAQIAPDAVQLMQRFIGKYEDGDMRREEFENGSAWYVHKIPLTPAKCQNAGRNVENAPGLDVIEDGKSSGQ